MTKTEKDRKPMLRVFKAIKQLRAAHLMATSPRIAPLAGRSCVQVANILVYLWEWGYVKKKAIKTPGNKRKRADGAVFEYYMTAKAEIKYLKLLEEFGDIKPLNIPEQPAKCCVTQESKPQGPAPVLSCDPLTRMQEIDRLLKGKK